METEQAIWSRVQTIIADIFDRAPEDIAPETRIMTDLGGESVDLLEIAVRINADFGIPVDEDTVFLKSLRYLLAECRAGGRQPEDALREAYPSDAGTSGNAGAGGRATAGHAPAVRGRYCRLCDGRRTETGLRRCASC